MHAFSVAGAASIAAGVLLFAAGQSVAPPSGTGSIAAPGAPSRGVLAPAGEPGERIEVSGTVVDAAGAPVAGASIYAYQTDAEGYYGVKPASDSANPRLKVRLRSDPKGGWAFHTIRPGSYPNSRVPGHIHFEVTAEGFARKIFEIVFEGDALVTPAMRQNPLFSVRPVGPDGRITQKIVLERSR